MFSTEFRYKLNNLRRILKKATVQLIRILFILASVATIVLMAYEYGMRSVRQGKDTLQRDSISSSGFSFSAVSQRSFWIPKRSGKRKDIG